MKFKTLTVIPITLLLAACEPDGPLEEFGEELDGAAYQAGDAAENAVGELERAANDAANAVKDACEDVTAENC